MKLTELEPRWFDVPGIGTDKDGISFLCPHCKNVRLGIQFANPIGSTPKPLMSWDEKKKHLFELKTFDVPMGFLWQRTGETFDDLTLTPSVDASKSGHWHGYITNGQIK